MSERTHIRTPKKRDQNHVKLTRLGEAEGGVDGNTEGSAVGLVLGGSEGAFITSKLTVEVLLGFPCQSVAFHLNSSGPKSEERRSNDVLATSNRIFPQTAGSSHSQPRLGEYS